METKDLQWLEGALQASLEIQRNERMRRRTRRTSTQSGPSSRRGRDAGPVDRAPLRSLRPGLRRLERGPGRLDVLHGALLTSRSVSRAGARCARSGPRAVRSGALVSLLRIEPWSAASSAPVPVPARRQPRAGSTSQPCGSTLAHCVGSHGRRFTRCPRGVRSASCAGLSRTPGACVTSMRGIDLARCPDGASTVSFLLSVDRVRCVARRIGRGSIGYGSIQRVWRV